MASPPKSFEKDFKARATAMSMNLFYQEKRAIGQKVLMTNPNKLDNCSNDVARSIQLHLPT